MSDRTRTRAQRVGLWLGIGLFFGILCMPVTPAMLDAAGDSVRRSLRPQIRTRFVHRGQTRPTEAQISQAIDAYLAEHKTWADAEARRRARAMIPAAAVTALVACWWITLAVPIPAASLLPLILLPLLGVMPFADAAANYADKNIFLFMGGFILALGIERWGLHRRIALHIVRLVGTNPSMLVLGFMIGSAFLSMWISNTATTLMMLPIGLAVISSLPQAFLEPDAGEPHRGAFAAALMLAIAYGASIGGIATPIGTPPNIVFKGMLRAMFPHAPEIGFGAWMVMFAPLTVAFVPLVWLILTRVTCPLGRSTGRLGRDVIREQLRALGPMSSPEMWMLAVFVAAAALWMFRQPIRIGAFELPGWADALGRAAPAWFKPAFLHDATVALAVAVLLFLIPGGRDEGARRIPLMDWRTAERLPWGILLLFGGGFAIAEGFEQTGLSAYVGRCLASLSGAPTGLLVLGVCLLLTFLTEVTSNTATTSVMLPVMAAAATTVFQINPLVLMIPATISASCAFMLPVATPPNAIVFGSGRVPMQRMVRSGLILNFAGAVLVTACFYLVVKPALGIDLAMPDWVR